MFGAILLAAGLSVTCNNDDDGQADEGGNGSPDQVGSVCAVPDDCYPDVEGELAGPALCLDRVRDGYCTHECSSDADCCAAEGECKTDLPQVCSPFESTGMMMCFLSCESSDVQAAGAEDDQAFCQHEASPDFICRSSGGGSNNRKVCVPGDCGYGADCAEAADCDGDLECLDEYQGGYCGRRDCETNGDCGDGARCVADGDATFCARSCDVASDCSFCRHEDHPGDCTDEVTYAEDGTTGSVCIVSKS